MLNKWPNPQPILGQEKYFFPLRRETVYCVFIKTYDLVSGSTSRKKSQVQRYHPQAVADQLSDKIIRKHKKLPITFKVLTTNRLQESSCAWNTAELDRPCCSALNYRLKCEPPGLIIHCRSRLGDMVAGLPTAADLCRRQKEHIQ